jgi:uncharacterized protein YprB with RNaseH-like and TPR domain
MKRLWLTFFVIPIFAQETEKDDSFIQKMEVKAPDQWLLAYIDVETTGLLPGHHEMIDMGIVMTLFSSANELN